MYFKIEGNDIYGIGSDTVGCYVITGNCSDMDSSNQYQVFFTMTYNDGWLVEFEGMLGKSQINGTWKSSSYTGSFMMRLNPHFNMGLLSKKLATFEQIPKKYGYSMEKQDIIDEEFEYPKCDINFFVNEEKKMEETILSYLSRYKLEEDYGVNYELEEEIPNVIAPPNSLGSKRNIPKPQASSTKEPKKDDLKKVKINMTDEFLSCGRQGPDYKFSFKKQYPSLYENQPFVLEHFEKLAADGLLGVNGSNINSDGSQNKGEIIREKDFLEL